MRKMRVVAAPLAARDGDVRQLALLRGPPLRRAELPRQGLAQRRPRPAGPRPRACSSAARRFHDYVEWALDAPMFLVKRGGEVIENTGQSFRSFMKHGFARPPPDAEGLGDAPQHALPRGAPQADASRCAAPTRCPANLVCALPGALDGHPLRRRARSTRPRSSRASFTAAELEALRARHRRAGARAPPSAARRSPSSPSASSTSPRAASSGARASTRTARTSASTSPGSPPSSRRAGARPTRSSRASATRDADLRQEILARARI